MNSFQLISLSPAPAGADILSRLEPSLRGYPNIPVRIVEATLDTLTAALARTAVAPSPSADFTTRTRHSGA